MKTTNLLTLLCLALMASASRALASGGPAYLLEKDQNFIQSTATGAVAAPYPYDLSVNAPAADKLTLSGGASTTLPYSADQQIAYIESAFTTKAALDAAFPDGNYSFASLGTGTVIALTPDSYPTATPQLTSGGTWTNGVLVVDPTVANTLQFSANTGFGAPGALNYMQFQINAESSGDNYSANQSIATQAIFGLTASSTPFTSFAIPAKSLTAGNVYQAQLGFANILTLNATAQAVSLFENVTTFYIVAKGATTPAAPVITTQPTGTITGVIGGSVTLPVTASNTSQSSIVVWSINGVPVDFQANNGQKYGIAPPTGNNGNTPTQGLVINSVTAADAGSYSATIVTAGGLVTTNSITLATANPVAPAITTQPQSVSLNSGATLNLSVVGTGGALTYQWFRNGTAISGATQSSYTISSAGTGNAGTYTVVVTNPAGTVTSAAATVTVAGLTAPVFTLQPTGQTSIVSGTTVVFTVAATGNPTPTYQWKFNGTAIAGATNPRLVIPNATLANAGGYTCNATSSQGSPISQTANLTIASTTNVGRLINLSVNTIAGKSQVLTVGFITGGSGTNGTETLLIRASGPALAALGVSNTLADPLLTLYSGSNVLTSNDNWGSTTANANAVTAADTATFAFPFTNTASLDAALVTTLGSGGYTATVSGNTAPSGTTVAEVYDDTASYTATSPRLINISCNTTVAAGGTLTAGFQVGGTTSKTVLIRATGPALAALGVSNTMPDPQVTLYSGSTALLSNAGWGGDPQITAVDTQVFAFALTNPNSKDSVILTTLAPGGYTAVASSVSGVSGVAVIEVYEVP